jgi:plasmid stabilization system protein ParE
MAHVNWTLQAKNDLKDIAEYISKHSIVFTKRQVFKIRLKTDILSYPNYTW